MAINTSNNKVRIISTTVGLANSSKYTEINSPALVVNTSDGGIFYADGTAKNPFKQLAALPSHTHSGYATTASLANYLPKTGGTLATTASTILSLNNTNSVNNEIGLRLDMNSLSKGWVGYTTNTGTYLYTYAGPHKLGIKEDGTGFIDGNTIIHSGNIGQQSVASAAKLTTGRSIFGNNFDGTTNILGGANATSLANINATASDANNWTGKYSLKLQASNNAMTMLVSSAENDRKGMIQVGHATSAYANHLGELYLNPLGGKVIIGHADKASVPLIVNGGVAANSFSGALYGNADTATTASIAIAVRDYNSSTTNIKIGYTGAALTSFNYFACYGTDASGNCVIKDADLSTVKTKLGLGSAAYTNSNAYIPADGGTARGDFAIRRDPAVIAYYKNAETKLGYMGIGSELTPVIYNAAGNTFYKILTEQNYSSLISGYATTSSLASYLPLAGGTLTGQLKTLDNYGIILRPGNGDYLSGISSDSAGNECIALWAKNAVTRLRWHAGIDMSSTAYNKMMSITPDFEISKASGTTIGYIAGNTIIHSGNYTSWCASAGHGHSGYAASSHTHDFANLTNLLVNTDEFNFISAKTYANIWFNYRAVNGTQGSYISNYHFSNGNGVNYASCTASNFITTSDKRFKKNITEISSEKLSDSLNLNFYEFDYKDNDKHSAGHIAQEVKEILPKFVYSSDTSENILSIDYTGLHSVQIAALKSENDELKSRISKLEKILEDVLSKLN